MTRADNDNGRVYTLDEAAEHLRLTNRGAAKIAKRHGLCMVAGRKILFTDGDIEKIKDVMPKDGLRDGPGADGSISYVVDSVMKTPVPHMGETMRDTSVYVISCGKFVKIGVAHDVNKRIQTLQSANPHRLDLVYSSRPLRSLTYAGIAERAAHKALSHSRVHSEWFKTRPRYAVSVVDAACLAAASLCEIHDRIRCAA